MICERCGCVFCWDDSGEETLTGTRKRFCSDTCRYAAKRCRRKGTAKRKTCDVCGREFQAAHKQQRRCSDTCRDFAQAHPGVWGKALNAIWVREMVCPTPAKRGFPSKSDALGKAVAVAHAFSYAPVRAYECLCGRWHLTSQPERVPRRGPLVP